MRCGCPTVGFSRGLLAPHHRACLPGRPRGGSILAPLAPCNVHNIQGSVLKCLLDLGPILAHLVEWSLQTRLCELYSLGWLGLFPIMCNAGGVVAPSLLHKRVAALCSGRLLVYRQRRMSGQQCLWR